MYVLLSYVTHLGYIYIICNTRTTLAGPGLGLDRHICGCTGRGGCRGVGVGDGGGGGSSGGFLVVGVPSRGVEQRVDVVVRA